MHDLILVEWKIVEHCVSMHVAGWTNSRSFLSSQTKRRCSSLGRVHCISSAVGLWSDRRRLLRLSTKKSKTLLFSRRIISSRPSVAQSHKINCRNQIRILHFSTRVSRTRSSSSDGKLGHGVAAERLMEFPSSKNFLVAPTTRCGQIGGKLRADALSRRRMTTHKRWEWKRTHALTHVNKFTHVALWRLGLCILVCFDSLNVNLKLLIFGP